MTTINPQRLADLLPAFDAYWATEGESLSKDRHVLDDLVATHFTHDSLLEIRDDALNDVVDHLSAFAHWGTEWLLSEILHDGVEPVRDALWQLLYGDDLLENRFDYIKATVRRFGAAAISELLTHHDPQVYGPWTARTRRGLLTLGIDDTVLPRSPQISGAQYVRFVYVMRIVLNDVQDHAPHINDLMMLGYFLEFAATQDVPADNTPYHWNSSLAEATDFNHDDVIEQLMTLGRGLGFDVEKEVNLVPGTRIDALWRSRVANLGSIAYAFEVHRHGNRDSAIMNLQRASSDPTIQKVVVVANTDELDIFRREIASLNESFRGAVGYFDVGRLGRALQNLGELKFLLDSLGLLNTSTLFD